MPVTTRTSRRPPTRRLQKQLAIEWLDAKIEQASNPFGAIFFISDVNRLRQIRGLLAPRLKNKRP